MKSKRVGLVGAGLMGGPMGLNWLKNGFPLSVLQSSNKNSQSQERISELKNNGAQVFSQIEELVRNSDIIVLMLPTSKEVEEICVGEGLEEQGRALSLISLVSKDQII